MIKIKRGKAAKWKGRTLAEGQPGYDKTNNKLKIGTGDTWESTKYLVGELDMDRLFQPSGSADDNTVFTYGTATPTKNTKGMIYLQQFEGAVEADFVVETGKSVNYFYRKWNSGFIECWGKGTIPTSINNKFTSIIFNVKTGDYYEIKGFWK